MLLTPATCRPLPGLRAADTVLRCSAAATPLPWRRGGTRPGRGVGRPWRRAVLNLSSLSFLLSTLFAFYCFPSLLVCSLFPLYLHLFSSPCSSPRIFFLSVALTLFLFSPVASFSSDLKTNRTKQPNKKYKTQQLFDLFFPPQMEKNKTKSPADRNLSCIHIPFSSTIALPSWSTSAGRRL